MLVLQWFRLDCIVPLKKNYQTAKSCIGEGDEVVSHAVEFLPSDIETNQFGRFLIFQLRTLKLEMLKQPVLVVLTAQPSLI